MDTNVKKFKYSYLGKVLCVILALVTGLSGIFLTTATVCTIANNVENSSNYTNYTDTQMVKNNLSSSLATSVDMAHLDVKGYEAYLKSQKQAVCKKAYNQISDAIESISSDHLNDDISEGDREEFLNNSIYDYYDPYFEQPIDEGKFELTCNHNDYFYYDEEHRSLNVTFNNYKTTLPKDIEKAFDKFVTDAVNAYKSTLNYECQNGIIYRVEKDGKVIDSNTSLSAAEIMEKPTVLRLKRAKPMPARTAECHKTRLII